jgi:hypothetical protein
VDDPPARLTLPASLGLKTGAGGTTGGRQPRTAKMPTVSKAKGGRSGRLFLYGMLPIFYRKRATNFINLPGKHDCTRLQGFDHQTFCVFFLKFCNSIVERRKLKM